MPTEPRSDVSTAGSKREETLKSRLSLRERVKTTLSVCLAREHVRRTGLTAVVVGTWLTAFNHANFLLDGSVGAILSVKIALNYVTPFVVANVGLLSRQDE